MSREQVALSKPSACLSGAPLGKLGHTTACPNAVLKYG